jgi:hypothetical protein
MTCDRSSVYGIRNYPACSDHGECIDNFCQCDEDWTGFTDLQLSEPGFDCDVNLVSIQDWSAINICLSSLSILVIIYCMVRERIYLPDRRFKAKFFCMVTFFGLNISALLFSIEKYQDPLNAIIGKSYTLELWGLGITSLTCYGISTYFIIMVKFLKTYSRLISPAARARIGASVDPLISYAPIFATFFFVSYGTLLLTLHFLPKDYSDSFCTAECILYTLAYVFYGFTLLYVLHVFLNEVSKIINVPKESTLNTVESSKNDTMSIKTTQVNTLEDTRKVYGKIKLANRFILPFYINGIPMNIFFAAWRFLRRKVVFFFLFQITLVILMSMFLVWSLTSVKKTYYESKLAEIHQSVKSLGTGRGNRSSISSHSSRRATVIVHKLKPLTVKISPLCSPTFDYGQTPSPDRGRFECVSRDEVIPI